MKKFLSLFLTLVPTLASVAQGARLRILIKDGGKEAVWARLEVRDASGKMYQPPEGPGVIRDRSARNRPETKPFYTGHFVARSQAVLEVPPGEYLLIAERGLEFTRVERRVTASEGTETRVELAPRRWVNMAHRGWWSADFHVHRPLEDALALVQAEELDLAVVFTMWNRRNLWETRNPPDDPVLRAGPRRLATVMNAEDERGGGAWMFHGLKRPLALGVEGRWFPQGKIFVEQARAQGAWFDMEKPFWWEVPVMMALAPPDSWGILNNHFDQYGIHAEEAWGRRRDRAKFPGAEGFVAYCLELYYRYLNLGFKLPASAGSASGVLPNPVGQNRAYAYLGRGAAFTPAQYYAAMRAGRTFSTNGPMLVLRVNGHLPGDTVELRKGEKVKVLVEALAREPIERLELVANGEVVDTTRPAAGNTRLAWKRALDAAGHTWLAARCFLAPGETIRMAHTSPVYFSGPGAGWNAREDARYFLAWLDELISISESEQGRFQNLEEKNQVLQIYRQARDFYAKRASDDAAAGSPRWPIRVGSR